jgi:peptidoglycan/LPS O-acetylase OafA/YrhL
MSHYWSLAVEEQFYLCWPWAVLALDRRRLAWTLVALLILAPVLRLWLMNSGVDLAFNRAYQEFTPLRMDGLAAGSLLAVVSREKAVHHLSRIAAWMLAAGLAIFIAVELKSPDRSGYVFGFSAVAMATTGGLILVLAKPLGLAGRTLNARWIRWVGTISYGVYIIHYPVALALRDRHASKAVEVGGTLFLTLLLASLSWYLLERPILKLKRFWPMPAPTAPGQELVAASSGSGSGAVFGDGFVSR